jgi:hypothetical protein
MLGGMTAVTLHHFLPLPLAILGAVVLTMIVTYDAQGVRRQAGEHARALNVIFAELLSGHEVSEEHLSEVLGHSRIEVFAGMLFGILVMLLWKLIVQALFR